MGTGAWGGNTGENVFRINILFRHGGQNCQTGFHLRDSLLQNRTPQDANEWIRPWVTTHFAKLLHTTDQIVGIDAINLTSGEGYTHSPQALMGTEPGTPAPSFLTIPISLKGSIRRRYGNGRMLWPVYNKETIEGNQIGAAGQTIVNGVITALADLAVGDPLLRNFVLCHAHKDIPAHGTRLLVPAAYYDVTSIRANYVFSSLKRRKTGVGA